MTLEQQLVAEISRLLRQGIALIDELDDRGYRDAEMRLSTSSIGAHVRHCIDHVQAFLHGLPEGRVDYDRRARDARIELERAHASRALVATLERLRRPLSGPRELQVRMDAPAGAEACWSASTVERELQGLVSHTVHHFALIAILVRAQGRTTATGFGIARSTLDYWRERDQAVSEAAQST